MIPEVTYEPETGFKRETIEAQNIMKIGKRFESEDLIKGVLHGIHFECADVITSEYQKSKSSASGTVYFKGQVFVI